ncbi:O-antigen ligase family protein [Jannaschia sp. KMU-145]|uniref:O-antigen ligase family protein n=1 Tax=Jannaschia halovivens TaxID=3388667 RepID=UPI00396AF4A7
MRGPAWLVPIYLIAVLVPISFHVGPLFLTTLRVLLLAVTLPLLVNTLRGRYGPVLATDWLLLGHALWIAVALGVNNPDRVIQQAPSVGVEFLGGYVVARAGIRSSADMLRACRLLLLGVLLTLPFALIEARTGTPPIIAMIRKLPVLGSVDILDMNRRLGVERVQAVFAHPIHYGLFCSVVFSMVFVAMKDKMGDLRRWIAAGAVAGCGFLALSSGALLAIALQVGLIAWAAIFAQVAWRWWLLLGLVTAVYIAIDLLSSRSGLQVFMTYATFSAHTAYWRLTILDWGLENIWANPIFGLGLRDWVRPSWMHSDSVDNFWLLTGMRYGLPGVGLLAAGWLVQLVRLMRLDHGRETELGRIRTACVFTIIGLTFTLFTVHVWTNIYSFTFFVFGATAWLVQPVARTEAPEPEIPADPRRAAPIRRSGARPAFTRFPAGTDARASLARGR